MVFVPRLAKFIPVNVAPLTAVWYKVLPFLKATHAATVQLSVPVIAAAGGMILLGEPLTLRFIFSSIAILSGIALVIFERSKA